MKSTAHRRNSFRISIDADEETLIAQQVADALAASPAERMAAAIELLDAIYDLWRSNGVEDDHGLCRFPGITQQRRTPVVAASTWRPMTAE